MRYALVAFVVLSSALLIFVAARPHAFVDLLDAYLGRSCRLVVYR